MEKKIKDIASNALSLLIASGIISEEEYNKVTADKSKGFDELFNLLQEKHKQFHLKA